MVLHQVHEDMDSRSVLGGFVLILAGCGGCALISVALSFPVSGFAGMLLVVLPVLVFLWFLEMRIRNLEDHIRSANRQIRRDVEDQGGRMAHRYDDTMRQIEDLNAELRRRVYR